MLNVIDLIEDVIVKLLIKLMLNQVVVVVWVLHSAVSVHVLYLAHGHAPVLWLHVLRVHLLLRHHSDTWGVKLVVHSLNWHEHIRLHRLHSQTVVCEWRPPWSESCSL